MAKATLNKKFKKYTGLVPPNDHRMYLTNRFGEEVISHSPHRPKKPYKTLRGFVIAQIRQQL